MQIFQTFPCEKVHETGIHVFGNILECPHLFHCFHSPTLPHLALPFPSPLCIIITMVTCDELEDA